MASIVKEAEGGWSSAGSGTSLTGRAGPSSNGTVRASVMFFFAVTGPLAWTHAGPGTGGMVTHKTLQAQSTLTHSDPSNAGLSRLGWGLDSVLDTGQRLQALKLALGLTITDMAELFDVARPSIYAWLKGQEPRPDKLLRLIEFEQAAEQVAKRDIYQVNKVLKRPLPSGDSLFSLIKAGESLDAALSEISATVQREQAQRDSVKGRHNILSSREVADYHSLASFRKDS